MEEKNIKHIVISGGGTFGLIAYSVLRETEKANFWKLENIESFHATSIGTLMSVIMALKFEWEVLDDYLIKRPWNQMFKYEIDQCLNAFENCGLFTIKDFRKFFEPLFAAKEIDIDITMLEFYEKTKKTLYFYAAEVNNFELECFSHTTHPQLKLVDACYASSSLPFIFKPLVLEDKAYIDGGLFLNYPIAQCFEKTQAEHNEVFGIFKRLHNKEEEQHTILSYLKDESNMFELIMLLISNALKRINKGSVVKECKYQIQIHRGYTEINDLIQFLNSESHRIEMIQEGVEKANAFLENLEN